MESVNIEVQKKMDKAIEHLKSEFAKVRTGRANPQILDRVMVDYYGTPTPVAQIGNVTVPDPQLILITPWEKSLLGEIEKAIVRADLGMNPQNDGNVIRLPIPQLTEDRRKDLVKQVKKIAEEGKVGIRGARKDGNDSLKQMEKDKEISEDDMKTGESTIQKQTDKYNSLVDEMTQSKEKELLEV